MDIMIMKNSNREFLYTTKWASGLIIVNEIGIIIDTAPIYKSIKGWNIIFLMGKLEELTNE